MRTEKVLKTLRVMEIDIGGRLLEEIEQYAVDNGITTEEAASRLLSFALKARFKSPKKKPVQVFRLSR